MNRSCVDYVPRGNDEERFCVPCQCQPKKLFRDSKDRPNRISLLIMNQILITSLILHKQSPNFKGECLLALIVIIRSNIIIDPKLVDQLLSPSLLRFLRTGADLSFDDDLDNDFEVLIISTTTIVFTQSFFYS